MAESIDESERLLGDVTRAREDGEDERSLWEATRGVERMPLDALRGLDVTRGDERTDDARLGVTADEPEPRADDAEARARRAASASVSGPAAIAIKPATQPIDLINECVNMGDSS